MKTWWILTLVVSLMLVACGDGDTQAETPNVGPIDCYAYGNCANDFGFNTLGYGNSYNFSQYMVPYGQNPYTNGFHGCQYNQYPVFYSNYGYACINHSAFLHGGRYGIWNYQPTSYQFMASMGLTFPSYYDYNNSFVFQGCVYGVSACACQNLYGVPSQYGVCAY